MATHHCHFAVGSVIVWIKKFIWILRKKSLLQKVVCILYFEGIMGISISKEFQHKILNHIAETETQKQARKSGVEAMFHVACYHWFFNLNLGHSLTVCDITTKLPSLFPQVPIHQWTCKEGWTEWAVAWLANLRLEPMSADSLLGLLTTTSGRWGLTNNKTLILFDSPPTSYLIPYYRWVDNIIPVVRGSAQNLPWEEETSYCLTIKPTTVLNVCVRIYLFLMVNPDKSICM